LKFIERIEKIIASGESETMDFKRKASDNLYKTLCAFANTKGGVVLLGVDDDGNVMNVTFKKEMLRDLANSIMNKLKIQPSIEKSTHQGKTLIKVEVEPSKIPISYAGRYYKRVGTNNVEISSESLGKFFLEKSGLTWDALVAGARIEEIDEKAVKKFVNLAHDRLPYISEKDSIRKILENLDLVEDSKMTNAAILLFGKRPQKYFFMARVRVGRFKDAITIIDDKEMDGNLFNQVEETMKTLQGYLQVRYEFTGELRRKEIWDYPLNALREAIINALIHRNYMDPHGDIQIKVFDDRLALWNPGKLMEGITLDDLKKEGHSSKLRNPLIAQTFYYAGLIEKWGTGTTKIVNLCSEQRLPEPEFLESSEGFEINFLKDVYTEDYLRKMGLNERQIKAVMYVKEKGRITNKEYQELCEVSKRAASENLRILEGKNILDRIGVTGKGTYYILKGK